MYYRLTRRSYGTGPVSGSQTNYGVPLAAACGDGATRAVAGEVFVSRLTSLAVSSLPKPSTPLTRQSRGPPRWFLLWARYDVLSASVLSTNLVDAKFGPVDTIDR